MEPLKEPPKKGVRVLVDDGTCGTGKIKKVTAGNGKDIPSKTECVARLK
ncbi:DUF6719 family protein [Labrys neptuniae]